MSPAKSDVAYIHFTGVDPGYRKNGVASSLYDEFIALAKASGRKYVKCVTSPCNTQSLLYHQKLGFKPSEFDDDGTALCVNDYDGKGNHRVVLTLTIST